MKKILLLLCCVSLNAERKADEAAHNIHRYFMANYYQYDNNAAKAAEWFKRIVPGGPQDRYVYLGYVPYLLSQKAYQEVISLLPIIDQSFKKNREMQLAVALALEQTGKKNEARNRLILLQEEYKTDQELTFKLAQMYMEHAEPENALATITAFLNKTPRRPNNYIFHFMVAQINMQLNKKEEALAAIQQAIEAYPKFDKSWLFYAILLEQSGRLQEAIQSYSTFLEMSPETHADIQRHITALAFRHKLSHGQLAPAQHPVEEQLAAIENLLAKKDFDTVLTMLGTLIRTDARKEIWLKILHLSCFVGVSYGQALRMLQHLEKETGHSSLILLYQADLALRDNKSDLAVRYLKKVEPHIQHPLLKAKVKLQEAIIHYEAQEWKKAQTLLEQAQELAPDYPPVANFLAYMYASKKNNLDKAEALITTALKHDARNPHFLDTQAFIYYKQGKYDKALEILQNIAQSCPTDYTILHHLGKCYAKKGAFDAATTTIKAALRSAKNKYEQEEAKMLLSQWKK